MSAEIVISVMPAIWAWMGLRPRSAVLTDSERLQRIPKRLPGQNMTAQQPAKPSGARLPTRNGLRRRSASQLSPKADQLGKGERFKVIGSCDATARRGKAQAGLCAIRWNKARFSQRSQVLFQCRMSPPAPNLPGE